MYSPLAVRSTPAKLAGPIAVRSTQFGAGECIVFARDLVERTGYRLPPSCTSNALFCPEYSKDSSLLSHRTSSSVLSGKVCAGQHACCPTQPQPRNSYRINPWKVHILVLSDLIGLLDLRVASRKKLLTLGWSGSTMQPQRNCPVAAWHTRTHDDPDRAAGWGRVAP